MHKARIWLRNGIVFAGAIGLLGGAGVAPRAMQPAAGQFQSGFPGPGTQPGTQSGQQGRGNNGHGQDDPNGTSKQVEERQAKARDNERQKRLVADSEKLLALATELHEEVIKTDKNILSVDVVRKAAEMEKLSRDLKERMKG